ncbi:P-loop containing nucleoside triphosphate hydrolase protein [Pelagophyceae sp. CCMP2097]|nr:P-loop containing nucleoside triphosphate hydrolase protein [Pelagophyceae sp. CCMP2097]
MQLPTSPAGVAKRPDAPGVPASPGGPCATRAAGLAAELEVGVEDARALLAALAPPAAPPDARALLHKARAGVIITFCKGLDVALGGGVAARQVTEICGAAGAGKTQLCMQLCVDVQIPKEFAGVAGTAIFVDAEGSFAPERLTEIATEMVAHIKRVGSKKADARVAAAAQRLSVGGVLDNVADHVELLATVEHCFDLVSESHATDKPVRLVVIDSMAIHMRSLYGELGVRSRLLARLALQLSELARVYEVSVIVTNQMTVDVESTEPTQLPALGEAWSHAADQRIFLRRPNRGALRLATVVKSPTRGESTASYVVDARGIRDAPAETTEAPGHKRPRDDAST